MINVEDFVGMLIIKVEEQHMCHIALISFGRFSIIKCNKCNAIQSLRVKGSTTCLLKTVMISSELGSEPRPSDPYTCMQQVTPIMNNLSN